MKVASSAITEIKYNPLWVTVTFNHGRSYRYWGVRFKTFREILKSDSIGRAYNELIKGQYRSEVAYRIVIKKRNKILYSEV